MKALLLCDDVQWERIGALARHRFEIGFRAGQQLRAQHLVLHLGYVPKTSPITRWVARCVDFWQDFLAARSPEMTIHLETRRGTLPVKEVCAALDRYAPQALWAIEAEGDGIELSLSWLRRNGYVDIGQD